jgi:segregation and condensation protein A
VFKLIEALDRVMKKSRIKFTHRVMADRISIADRIQQLVKMLIEKRELSFDELFVDATTRDLIVATFLSILEMARLRLVRLHQTEASDVIHIRGTSDFSDADSLVINNLEA